jgi:hypothetical protein
MRLSGPSTQHLIPVPSWERRLNLLGQWQAYVQMLSWIASKQTTTLQFIPEILILILVSLLVFQINATEVCLGLKLEPMNNRCTVDV